MTPARLKALQWFHDRGEVKWSERELGHPSKRMMKRMGDDQQLQVRFEAKGFHIERLYALTDKGRQDLHEGSK